MSFRQDRTNPSTAVSNWHGRSETPKGWPSTRVSTWLNGGLFSTGGSAVYECLGTHTFDGTTASHSFTSIPQIYADLRLIIHSAMVSGGSTGFNSYVRVNSVSSNNYDNAYFYQYSGNTDSHTAAANHSIMGMAGVIWFNSTPQNEIWDFIDYANTTSRPHYQSLFGQTLSSNGWNWLGMAQGDLNNSTGAITDVQLIDLSNNYPNGTTVSLFGIGEAY